jgi:hypothetical protein
MNEARCAATLAALTLTLTAGCSDAFLVELGRGQIGQVVVDRTFPTGFRPYEGCPSVRIGTDGSSGPRGEIVVAPLSKGCLLALHMEDAVLLNDATMAAWSDALVSYDMNALIAIDIIVDELVLDGGRSVDLGADEVHSVSIALDDRVLLDLEEIQSLDTNEVRLGIPDTLVDRFVTSLDERRAFTGTIDVRVVLRPGVQIPRILHLRTMLQPVLLVDGWGATF